MDEISFRVVILCLLFVVVNSHASLPYPTATNFVLCAMARILKSCPLQCLDSNFGKENTSFICTLVENGDRQWRLLLHQVYVSLRFFIDKWKALTV